MFYSVLGSSLEFNSAKIIYNLLTGRAQAQLYYILVLVELTLLTLLLMKAVDNKKLSILILSISPIYLLLTSGYRYCTGAELSWVGRDFCAWIIFYYFGMTVKRNGWKQRNKFSLCLSYVIALMFSALEGLFANSLNLFSLAISQVKISSMIYSLIVIAVIMNRCLDFKKRNLHHVETNKDKESNYYKFKKKITNSLIYIGDISFGIYFCHTFILKCVTFVLSRVGIMDIFPLPLIQLVQVSLTLIFSVIGINIVLRIDAKRRVCPYIGF